MKIKSNVLFIDHEFDDQHINMDKTQERNVTFFEALKLQQKQNKPKLNVYEIAAKIARGEFVSAEELKYIKENAPTLYMKALMMYEENKQRKMDNKAFKHGENNIYMIKDTKNEQDKADKSNDGIYNKLEVHNSTLNLGEDESMESILQAL